jgi:hypothetical protein
MDGTRGGTMKYFVGRGDQQYGPYTLEELGTFVAQRSVAPTDWVRREDSADWVAASQVVGPGAPPVLAPPYGAAPSPASGQAGTYPDPPEMHWALVLLLGIVTCGIFLIVWAFRQAAYAKKLDPSNRSTLYYVIYAVCYSIEILLTIVNTVQPNDTVDILARVFQLGAVVCLLVGAFALRDTLESHFRSEEPVGLELSGVITFFFNTLYFQYHLSRIAKWRRTGVLA